MKPLWIFLCVALSLTIIISCEKTDTSTLIGNSLESDISSFREGGFPSLRDLEASYQLQLAVQCPDPQVMPSELIELCLHEDENKQNCEGAERWLSTQWNRALRKCEKTKSVEDKYEVISCELIPLTYYYFQLGLQPPCFCTDFCGLISLYEQLNEECAATKVADKRPIIEKMFTIRLIALELGFEEELNCIPESCTGFCDLVKYYDKLNNTCGTLKELDEKQPYLDSLIELAGLIQELEIPWSENPAEACGCILDESNEDLKIEIDPSDISLALEEEIELKYDIFCNCDDPIICEGDVAWEIDDPSVATIDPESGTLTAKDPGTAIITIKSTLFPHIKGTANVKVGKGYDIALVFENGYKADWIVGGQYSITGWLGLQQLGNELVSTLNNLFGDDYRFGLVGFDHYPILPFGSNLGYCEEVGNAVPEFQPLIEMDDFLPYLGLTDDRSSIASTLENEVQMMCTWSEVPFGSSSSPFSAVIKTIRNFDWREDANKIVILYGQSPATYRQGSAPASSEGYSGYTVRDIASAATEKGVKVFTINGFVGRSGDIAEVALDEYEAIANTTSGKFYQGDINSTLEPLSTMLQQIKEMDWEE